MTQYVYTQHARESQTVTTPLKWEEVERALTARDAELLSFTCDEVLERVSSQGDLFAPVLTLTQQLPVLSAPA